MAQYFGKQGQPKAKRNPAMEDTTPMPNPAKEFMDKVASGKATSLPPALNKGKNPDPPKKDTAAPPTKGMGVGKPLMTKSFTHDGEKLKITITKEK